MKKVNTIKRVSIADYSGAEQETLRIFSCEEILTSSVFGNHGASSQEIQEAYSRIEEKYSSMVLLSGKSRLQFAILVGAFEGKVFPAERPQIVNPVATIVTEKCELPINCKDAIPDDRLRGLLEEFDVRIIIDRNCELLYPYFATRVIHSEKEGAAEIDITKLEKWFLHVERWKKTRKGVYDELIATGLIDRCFGFRELMAIQKRSVDFFRHNFGEKLTGWKGAVESEGGFGKDIECPYLLIHNESLVLLWELVHHVQNDDEAYSTRPDAYLL